MGLNEDLTEAIALGHDIGHTPFGHQGEHVLNKIMNGEIDSGSKLNFKLNYGGFKHNFNSIRILDFLEKKFENELGLNLTWQTLDGILKHTRIENIGNDWDIKRFMPKSNHRELIEKFMDYTFPITLEIQVVAIADEIAQRQHDLDDGLRDKDLGLMENKIIGYIQDIIRIETAKMAIGTYENRNIDEPSPETIVDNFYVNVFTPEIVLLEELESKIEKREIKTYTKKKII